MPIYVSSSSRLHSLLVQLSRQNAAQPLRTAWAAVLDIPGHQVQWAQFGLPRLAALADSAADEADKAYELVALPVRPQLIAEWRKPIWASGGTLDAHLQSFVPTPESIAYLESIASVLHKRESHTELPAGDELAELIELVDDLANSVEAASELPGDVRRVLLRRIAQVRLAIDYVRIGGAGDVQEAVEMLLGATMIRGSVTSAVTVKKIAVVAAAVFAIFTSGPKVQASLEAWPKVVAEVTGGADGQARAEQSDGDDGSSLAGDTEER